MARNPVTPGQAMQQQREVNGGVVAGHAPMLGGAPGIPTPGQVVDASPRLPILRREAEVKARRFRVMNGGMVAQNGLRTALRPGKEISDAQYDVKQLQRQGIVLKELVDDEVAVQEPLPGTKALTETAAPEQALTSQKS